MTYSLINKCAKNYYNRTFTVPVIAKNVVTAFFETQCRYFTIFQLKITDKFQLHSLFALSNSLLTTKWSGNKKKKIIA